MEEAEGQEPQQSRLESFSTYFKRVTYTDLQIMARADSRGASFFDKSLDVINTLAQPLNWIRLLEVSTLGVHRSREFIESSSMTVDEVDQLIEQVRSRSPQERLDRLERHRRLIVGLTVLNIPVGIATVVFIKGLVGIPALIYAGIKTIEMLGTPFSLAGYAGSVRPNVRMGARGVREQTQQPDTSQETARPETQVTEEPSVEPEAPPAEEPPPEVEEPVVETVPLGRRFTDALQALAGRALDTLETGRRMFRRILHRRQRVEGGHEESETPVTEAQPDEEAAPAEEGEPRVEVAHEEERLPDRVRDETPETPAPIQPAAGRNRRDAPETDLRDIDTGVSVPLSDYLDENRGMVVIQATERDRLCSLLGTPVASENGVNSLTLLALNNRGLTNMLNGIAGFIYNQKLIFTERGRLDLVGSGVMSSLRFLIINLVGEGFGASNQLYNDQFVRILNQYGVMPGTVINIGDERLNSIASDLARIWLGDTLYEAGTRERQGLLRTVAGGFRGLWQGLGGGRRRAGDGRRTGGSEERHTDRQAEFGVPLSEYSTQSQETLIQDERASLESWMGVGTGESNALRVLAQRDTILGDTIEDAVNSVFRLKVDYMDDESTPDVPLTMAYIIMFLERLNTERYITEGNMSERFRALLPEDWQDGKRLDEIGIQQVANRLLRAWLGYEVYTACGGEIEVRAAVPVVERPEAPGWRARWRERWERIRGWWRGRWRRAGGRAEARDRTVENLRVPLDAYRAPDADRAELIRRERRSFYAIAGVEEEGKIAMGDVIEQDSFISGILDDLSETVYIVKNDAAYTVYDEQNWNTVATRMWIFLEGLLRMPGVTESIFSENVRQILLDNRWRSGRDLEEARLQAAGREVLHLWLGDEVWGILRRQIEQSQHATAAPAETAGGSVEGFGLSIIEYEELVRTRREMARVQESVSSIPLAKLFEGESLEKTNELADLQERERELLEGFRLNERQLLFKFLGPRAEEMYSGTTADGDFHGDINILIRLFVEMKRALYEEDEEWFGNYIELFNTLDTIVCRLLMNIQARGYRLGNAFTEELNRYGVNMEDPSSMPDELNSALRRIVELWLGTDLYDQLQQYI